MDPVNPNNAFVCGKTSLKEVDDHPRSKMVFKDIASRMVGYR